MAYIAVSNYAILILLLFRFQYLSCLDNVQETGNVVASTIEGLPSFSHDRFRGIPISISEKSRNIPEIDNQFDRKRQIYNRYNWITDLATPNLQSLEAGRSPVYYDNLSYEEYKSINEDYIRSHKKYSADEANSCVGYEKRSRLTSCYYSHGQSPYRQRATKRRKMFTSVSEEVRVYEETADSVGSICSHIPTKRGQETIGSMERPRGQVPEDTKFHSCNSLQKDSSGLQRSRNFEESSRRVRNNRIALSLASSCEPLDKSLQFNG